MHRIIIVLALLLGFAAAGAGAAVAQEATPPSGDVVACTAEARPIDELVSGWFGPDGSPVPMPEMEMSPVTEAELPAGEPADDATIEAMRQVVLQIDACFASEQYARAYSLMTDELAVLFGPDLTNPDEDSAEEVRALLESQAAATPMPGQPATIEGPRDARVLPDGRVGGIFSDQFESFFLIFEQVDGEWLADEVIPIMPSGENGMATPTS